MRTEHCRWSQSPPFKDEWNIYFLNFLWVVSELRETIWRSSMPFHHSMVSNSIRSISRMKLLYMYIYTFTNTHMIASLPHLHTHLLSSDQERHLWLPKYFKFPCGFINVYFHPEISSFFRWVFHFLSYLLRYIYIYGI